MAGPRSLDLHLERLRLVLQRGDGAIQFRLENVKRVVHGQPRPRAALGACSTPRSSDARRTTWGAS